jgi:light-harvesting complex 1 beta chain
MWRPWIPGPEGYSSIEGLHQTFSALSSLVA